MYIYNIKNSIYTYTCKMYPSIVPARPGKGAGGQGLWSQRLFERGAGTKRPAAAEPAEPADAEVPSRGWRSMVNDG